MVLGAVSNPRTKDLSDRKPASRRRELSAGYHGSEVGRQEISHMDSRYRYQLSRRVPDRRILTFNASVAEGTTLKERKIIIYVREVNDMIQTAEDLMNLDFVVYHDRMSDYAKTENERRFADEEGAIMIVTTALRQGMDYGETHLNDYSGWLLQFPRTTAAKRSIGSSGARWPFSALR